MKKFFLLFAFLLTSLCSLTALATPTVGDVEEELAAGQYGNAKVLIKEVLKEHPNSIVAHRYMLQILDIEYAETLKPSVEYKLYENRITAIQAQIKEEQEKAIVDTYNAKMATILKVISVIIVIGLSIAFFILVIRPWRINKAKLKAEKEKLEAWEARAWEDVVTLGIYATTMLDQSHENNDLYTKSVLNDLNNLIADNDDVMGCLERKDYNVNLIDRHVRDSYEFYETHGIHK